MPTEMIKEFIGKECIISLFNEVVGVQGTIIAIEENWIKVEEKKKIRIINGDMIRDIATAKQKHFPKFQVIGGQKRITKQEYKEPLDICINLYYQDRKAAKAADGSKEWNNQQ